MSWAVSPHATGSTSIAMTATTATDLSGVEYYFTCTAGNGNDSGWQDGETYEDTGLSPEGQYTYTAAARDKILLPKLFGIPVSRSTSQAMSRSFALA